MQKKRMDELGRIDELQIETLTDEELEMVEGGGWTDQTTAASCSCCVAGATMIGGGGKPSV